jgi:hypothetical protein
MADQFITELDAATTFEDTGLFVLEHDPSGTPETMKITTANVLSEILRRTTYQISRTISANDLVVALKNPDGSDPSTARPLSFNIAGSIRKLSSALSITIADGTNSFNLGAAELGGTTQDLFVYAGWRASTSTIFLMLHRLPHLTDYSQASSTATNENYGAITGAAPDPADVVANIGRVSAQLSLAGTSHLWSVGSGGNVLSYPTFETRWMTWNGTPGGFSSNPTGVGRYKFNRNTSTIFRRDTVNGTSNAGTFTYTLPFSAATVTSMVWGSAAVVFDNGTQQTTPGALRVQSGATTLEVFKDFANTAFTGSGGKRLSQMNPMVYEV